MASLTKTVMVMMRILRWWVSARGAVILIRVKIHLLL